MSQLTVNIVPAVEDRGPRTFSTHNKHDAETVISLLKYLHGEGYLTYPNGVIIPSDPENQLEAGEYFFTMLSAPQGVIHSLVLAESDHFSSARLGYQLHQLPPFCVTFLEKQARSWPSTELDLSDSSFGWHWNSGPANQPRTCWPLSSAVLQRRP